MIIVGGGVIGSELGGAYRMLGSKITIVEGLDHILNGFDKEMSDIIANRVKLLVQKSSLLLWQNLRLKQIQMLL